MSRNFTTQPAPFTGSIIAKPISLCTPLDKNERPQALTLEISWSQPPYNRGAVLVDLSVQGAYNPIQKIRSVIIDNTNVGTAVYVQFDDTHDVVTCLPNSVVRVAVFTDQLQCTVFCDSVSFAAGRTTRIFLSNVYLDPLVNQERNNVIDSWLISNFNNADTIYNAPAQGDATVSGGLSLTTINTVPLLAARTTGFYIITNISMFTIGVYSTTVPLFGQFVLDSQGVFTIYAPLFVVPTDLTGYGKRKIEDKQFGCLWIAATAAITLRNLVALPAGTGLATIHYTYSSG